MQKKGIILLLLVTLFLSACSSTPAKEAEKAEVLDAKDERYVVGQTWVVPSLDPTEDLNSWSLVSHGVCEYVYMLDEEGNLWSRYIDELEQVDDLTWNGKMKEDVLFSDGSKVDAKALCDSMNAIQEKNAFSNQTAGKIVFTAIDEFNFEAKTERPTKVLDSIFAEWTNVVFKDLGNGEFVFSGPYVVKSFKPDMEIELVPNEYYEDHEKRNEVLVKAFKDESSLKLAYESGELDMAFVISPEIAETLEKQGKNVKNIDAGYQYFAQINLENEKLQDLELRQALDLGLNREDYIKALKGGRVANGLFAQYYSFAGEEKLEYNQEKAKEILDSLGWIEGKDGIREKDGEKLSLRLVTYPTRPDLTIIMQIMSSQLRELGIESTTELQEDIYQVGVSGEFDILLHAQHTAPTAEPSFFLNQFFRTGSSTNHSRYSSERYDAVMDKLGDADLDQRDALAKEAQHVLHEELPVLFLIDPEWNIAVSERLIDYKPFCGDYYIVNSYLGL